MHLRENIPLTVFREFSAMSQGSKSLRLGRTILEFSPGPGALSRALQLRPAPGMHGRADQLISNNLIHDCGVFGKQIAGVFMSVTS